MERFVICCGQILQMRAEMDLGRHQEGQDTVGERMLQISSTIETIWKWSVVHISWSCKGTIMHTTKSVLRSFQLQIIVTVVEIKPQFLKLMTISNIITINTTHQIKKSKTNQLKECLSTFYDYLFL